MKKIVLLLTLAATLAALSNVPSWAQAGYATIKGKVTDENGPMVGITLEYLSKDTGHKYSITTDKKGEYFSIGVQSGTYRVTLAKDGTAFWIQDNVQVSLAVEDSINVHDFDLVKLRASAMSKPGQPKVTTEQIRQIEQAKRESAKIQTLNEKLAAVQAAEEAKDWDQAISILTEATTIDPTKHALWGKLCEVELGARKLDEAAADCQKAISIAQREANLDEARLAGYHNNLGQAYAKSGKIAEAMAEYSAAAQIDPTKAGVYYFNLGAVLTNRFVTLSEPERTRVLDQSIEAFDKAITADPNNAEAYFLKASNLMNKATLDKNNKMVVPPGTAEAFNKYLELEPAGRHAEEVKGMLAYIGAEVQTSYGKSRTKK